MFNKFADFPTRLDFLLDYPGGGLTWIGTYGPMSRFEKFADDAMAIMERFGMPPLVVSRPMLGGHFGVLRFVSLFDKGEPDEVQQTRELQAEVAESAIQNGFIIYKTPAWVVERVRERLDVGFLSLFRRIREALDPKGVFNPQNLPY
jgi:FAD/FMN-containing dehydrogenase